jgi:hypothetical protein
MQNTLTLFWFRYTVTYNNIQSVCLFVPCLIKSLSLIIPELRMKKAGAPRKGEKLRCR